MKKLILIFLISIQTLLCFGQISKGTIMSGLSFNYYQSKNSQNQFTTNVNQSTNNISSFNNTFSSCLRLGYFVTNRIAIGFSGAYNTATSKTVTEYNNSNTTLTKQTLTSLSASNSLGLFARGYKMFNSEKMGLFAQLDAFYQFGKSSGNQYNELKGGGSGHSPSPKGEITGASVGLSPGFVYFIGNKIGLEVSFGNFYFFSQKLSYYQTSVPTTESKSSGLNFSLAPTTLYFGICFYFAEKKFDE